MASPTANRSLQFSPPCTTVPSPGGSRPIATPFSDLRSSPRAGEALDETLKPKDAIEEAPETLRKLQTQLALVVDQATATEGLRADNARLRSELEKKDNDANGHVRELWSVRAQMQTKEKDLAAERETANNLREKLGTLRDEHSSIKDRVVEMEKALQQAEVEIRQKQTDHDNETAALEQEIAKERDLANEKLRKIEEKAQQLRDLQALTEDLKQQVEDLKVYKDQAKDIEEARKLAAQQLDKQAVDLATMKDRLEEQEREAAARESEVADQERRAAEREAELSEKVQQLEMSCARYEREASERETKFGDQERRAKEREAELSEKVQQLEMSCKRHECAASERETEFGEMMRQLEEMCESKKQQWLSESSSKDQELEKLQKTSSAQVAELSDSIALLEQQGNEAAEREAQLTEKLRQLEETFKTDKVRMSQERNKDMKQVRETLNKREADLQSTKARLEEQSKKASEREVEFKELAQRLDEANKSKAKLHAKVKEQAQAVEAAQREKKHDLALVECVREKEREIVELQSELERNQDSLHDKDEVIREQACELAELEVRHQDQTERLHTCERELERIEQQKVGRVEPMHSVHCHYEDDIDVRLQNRDLLLTTKQLHQECEMLETENRSLKETNEYYIDELDQHANNIGHTNHKQKIRYTLKLKEELNRLFMELRKSRQRILQLEANQVNCGLLGSRTYEQKQQSPPSVGEGHSVRRRHSTGTFASPRRASPSQKRGSPRPSPCASPGRDEARVQHRAEEIEHACHLQSVALEKLNVDHQHLKTLVERVVLRSDYVNGDSGSASTSELLERLRESTEQSHNVGAESHERARCASARASKHA